MCTCRYNAAAIALLFFLVIVSFSQCEDPLTPEEEEETAQAALSALDIFDARALYIAPTQVNGAGKTAATDSEVVNRLFKITTDDLIQQVSYVSDEGDTMEASLYPNNLYDAGPDHLLISFSASPDEPDFIDEAYLVRKSDGAVFQLDYDGQLIFPQEQQYFANYGTVQVDQNGDIYFQNYFSGRMVYSLSISGEEVLSEPVSPPDESIEWFITDYSGNVAVANSDMEGRVITTDGSLFNLPGVEFWMAANDSLYVSAYHDAENYYSVLQLNCSGDTPASLDTFATGLENVPLLMHGSNYLITMDNRTLIVVTAAGTGNGVWEVYNPDRAPRMVAAVMEAFTEFTSAGASDDLYYIAGNGADAQPLLAGIDPLTDTVIPVTREYDIQSITVSPEDHIYFTGLRMSDAAKVVGEIDAAGSVTILDEELSGPAYALTRIQ